MILLPIAITSSEWNAVKAYIAMRSSELTDEATNPATSDEARRSAAIRLDELKMLARAPEETLEATAAKAKGDETRSSTY